MLPNAPQVHQAFARMRGDGFAFEEVVDICVRNPEGFFIGQSGALILQISGGHFFPQSWVCPQVRKQLCASADQHAEQNETNDEHARSICR